MKDLRPFAQHTEIKELSSLHNDSVFDEEMEEFLDEIKAEKKLMKKRYREIEKKGAGYMLPTQNLKNSSTLLQSQTF